MDIGFTVLALLMAFTGFFMLVGGFGVLMYLLWQQGRESPERNTPSTSEQEARGQQ
jgi:hypothetical protein